MRNFLKVDVCFQVHTFRPGGAWCDFCGNFMWGLVSQGLKCQDCGFAAHKKCSTQTRSDCQPDLKYVRRQFAVDLSTLCMAHHCEVPPVVTQCIAEIERRGLHSEGIYRVPGFHEEVEELKVLFDTKSNNL